MSPPAKTAPAMWSRLVGQDDVVRALRDGVEAGTVGHAYLFAGPEGVGRRLAALALAASLNCPDGGCGECNICSRVLRGAHPDVHLIFPEGQQILLAQIKGGPGTRGLIADAHRSPVEGTAKVFIVEDADRMNASAANALLKVLEEPPAGVVFVLMTGRPDDLPSTVVSRCRRLDFSPLPIDAVTQVLTAHHGIEATRASWAARVGGNLAWALRLAHDEDAPSRYAFHREIPAQLAQGGPGEAVRLAAQLLGEAESSTAWLRDRQTTEIAEQTETAGSGARRGAAARETAAIKKRLETRHKREQRRAETDALQAALDDLASWYRDSLGESASGATVASALERIGVTRRALDRNAAPVLAIEALFVELAWLARN